MKKARDIILKIFKYLGMPEMRILPGQLAFFLVITIIPMLALVATFAAALSISTDTIRVAISESVPPVIADILNGIITGEGINFNIIVFYFSALLLASNGAYSIINMSNEIYKIGTKSVVVRRLKAFVMTFTIVILLMFLLAVPVFGDTLSMIIVQLTGSTAASGFLHNVLSIFKYPLILLFLFFNLKMLYVAAPDEEIPSNTTNKGAIFTALGWVLSTEIFGFYLDTFAKYDIFYGSISNILVLLLWIYLLSYIFTLGMIINVSDYRSGE